MLLVRIPNTLLRDQLVAEPFLGIGGTGQPVYDVPVTLRARVEGRRRLVRTPDGTDVTSTATAFIRPEAPEIPANSKITHDGREYGVLDVVHGEGWSRESHRELLLGDR